MSARATEYIQSDMADCHYDDSRTQNVGEYNAGAVGRCRGTSQSTIAAYESGAKSPNLRTVERLAASVGRYAVVVYVRPLTREDRRSLALHRAIAEQLIRSPETVLPLARKNLHRMRGTSPGAEALLDEWERILDRSVEGIVEVMADPGAHARDLRQVTPFAGVLAAKQRAAVYERFAKDEKRE